MFLTCGRWPHYHQPTDTPEKLAWEKMALIRDYVVALATILADSELSPASDETTAMEIRYFEIALGPQLAEVLALLGIDALRNRLDLERLAAKVQGFGL